MKRHNSHLPTLNALYLQNINYQKHKQHLQRSKSSYEYLRNLSAMSSEDHNQLKVRVNSQTNQACENSLKISMMLSQGSHTTPSSEKPHQRALKPYEKRIISEKQQENMRILLALQSDNPSRYRYDHESEQSREILKSRISKYMNQGAGVRYKFKKSLAEIERRKLLKKKSMEIQKPMILENIKLQHQALQKRKCSRNTTQTKKTKQTSCSDIYTYNFIQPKKNRGACPSHLQQRQNSSHTRKLKTYQHHQIKPTTQDQSDTFANKYEALKHSLQLRLKCRIRPAIVVGNSSTLVIGSKASRAISDVQTISLPPISNRQ